MFGQRGGSDAFGRRAVKNIGIRTDIGQTFAETDTTGCHLPVLDVGLSAAVMSVIAAKLSQSNRKAGEVSSIKLKTRESNLINA